MPDTRQPPSSDLPGILFASQAEFEAWLEQNHAASTGIWLQLAKKGSHLVSISYAEAVESALCYGWIDSQSKGINESVYVQKFTPRGRKSIWSKINREKALELIRSGRMRPAGLAAIERAKEDGRWEAAYDSQRTATIPDDFRAELDRSPEAREFFATLDGANRYAILFRIQTAKKPETRKKRIQQFIQMLENHEQIYP